VAGPAGGSFRIGIVGVLLVVVLTALLVIAHEAIHALVMLRFGARPSFGATLVGRVMPGCTRHPRGIASPAAST
jgi:hypothetical protein